jgi:hypothetical protein
MTARKRYAPMTDDDVGVMMSSVQTAALLMDDNPRPEHKRQAEAAARDFERISAVVCGRLANEVRARNRRRAR